MLKLCRLSTYRKPAVSLRLSSSSIAIMSRSLWVHSFKHKAAEDVLTVIAGISAGRVAPWLELATTIDPAGLDSTRSGEEKECGDASFHITILDSSPWMYRYRPIRVPSWAIKRWLWVLLQNHLSELLAQMWRGLSTSRGNALVLIFLTLEDIHKFII